MNAGAATYLLKEALGAELVPVIREVHSGGKPPLSPEVARQLADRHFQPQLTAREIEVPRLIADRLRNKEIAQELGISDNTAQGHVKSILAKLRVNDRAGAVTLAIRRDILRSSS
jgi:DNA-binding NarL/FixJ family response regulator